MPALEEVRTDVDKRLHDPRWVGVAVAVVTLVIVWLAYRRNVMDSQAAFAASQQSGAGQIPTDLSGGGSGPPPAGAPTANGTPDITGLLAAIQGAMAGQTAAIEASIQSGALAGAPGAGIGPSNPVTSTGTSGATAAVSGAGRGNFGPGISFPDYSVLGPYANYVEQDIFGALYHRTSPNVGPDAISMFESIGEKAAATGQNPYSAINTAAAKMPEANPALRGGGHSVDVPSWTGLNFTPTPVRPGPLPLSKV